MLEAALPDRVEFLDADAGTYADRPRARAGWRFCWHRGVADDPHPEITDPAGHARDDVARIESEAHAHGVAFVTDLGAAVGDDNGAHGSLSLEPVEVSDLPQNPYHLIVVATSPVRAAGELFLDWLLGPDGREAIRRVNLELFDRVVYEPAG